MGRRMSYRQSAAARKEIRRLTEQVERLQNEYAGTFIASETVSSSTAAAIKTARALDHIVTVTVDGNTLAVRAIRKEAV